MSKKKGAHLQRYRAPGGGALQRGAVPGSSSLVSVGIDLSKAPIPERRYVADVAAVVVSDDIVRLLFGQTQVVGKQLRTLLDVHVPAVGIVSFLESLRTQGMPETFAVLREKLGREGRGLYEITEEPKQSVGLAVNLIAMAVTAREACLDMYYASTFILSKAVRGMGPLSADPVVRVSLPSAVLLALVARLESLRDSLPENI